MAIYRREVTEEREYFNDENALVKKQDASYTIKLFGIKVVSRKLNFNAEIVKKDKNGIGYNQK